jgi:hypothetical protein
MSNEFREIYINIPAVVRGLFHSAEKAQQAGEHLKSLGLSPRDLEVIPITPTETRRVSRPLLEVLGLRKKKKVAEVARQFIVGDAVVIVRLHEWKRDQAEQALREAGADEVTYFPPPGEEGIIGARITAARPT